MCVGGGGGGGGEGEGKVEGVCVCGGGRCLLWSRPTLPVTGKWRLIFYFYFFNNVEL